MSDFNIADYISVREAADELGVSRDTILGDRRMGRLDAVPIGPRYYIHRTEFAKYKALRGQRTRVTVGAA